MLGRRTWGWVGEGRPGGRGKGAVNLMGCMGDFLRSGWVSWMRKATGKVVCQDAGVKWGKND